MFPLSRARRQSTISKIEKWALAKQLGNVNLVLRYAIDVAFLYFLGYHTRS